MATQTKSVMYWGKRLLIMILGILAIATALMYIFSPVDFIPDTLGFIGYVDDAFFGVLIFWIYYKIKKHFEKK